MSGIASVGECMLELSGRDADWRMGHAGDAFNTLWTLRAIMPENVSCDFVSAFGDDPFSQAQLDFLRGAGIGIAASPRIPGARPGLYAITLDGAERSFTYWRSDSAARRLAEDPAALEASLCGRDLVYFSGITLAILDTGARETLLASVAKARESGAMVAFDPNYRPRLWSDANAAKASLAAAWAVSDIGLPTFPDEQALYGEAANVETAQRILAAGVRELVVKNGELPALLATEAGIDSITGVRVAHPVDTTGAGDSFNGAYLASRLLGKPPRDAVAAAHRVAAAVVQLHGALAPPDAIREAFGA